MEVARLTARRAVHGHHVTERHTERPQTRHAQSAHREILVIRINLHLHRAGQFHPILLLVRGNRTFQLRQKVGIQQVRLFPMQLQNGRIVFENDEVLITIQQPQTVDRRLIAVTVRVALLELLPGFGILTQTHQIDTELRACRPEQRVCRDGFTEVSDAVQVASPENEVMRHERITLTIGRIEGADPGEPRIGRAIGEQLDTGVNRHGVQR